MSSVNQRGTKRLSAAASVQEVRDEGKKLMAVYKCPKEVLFCQRATPQCSWESSKAPCRASLLREIACGIPSSRGNTRRGCCLHDGVAFENYRGLVRVELPEIAPDTRATMPAPRRNVRSTPDGGSAVQPPGLSYTAHWEALGCALCLLTTPEISSTGPVRGRGFCPGSHRPRARVPLVVWAWDFLFCGFLAAVSSPLL